MLLGSFNDCQDNTIAKFFDNTINLNYMAQRRDPVIDVNVSFGARKIAKALAVDIWKFYQDKDMVEKNLSIPITDPDCMIYFFGQFSANSQKVFISRLKATTNFTFRNEIASWIEAYYQWFNKDGERKS